MAASVIKWTLPPVNATCLRGIDDSTVGVGILHKSYYECSLDVEPIGRPFEIYQTRNPWHHIHSHHHHHGKGGEADGGSSSGDSDGEEFEDNDAYLRSLDPKDWKDQDHYNVLGLKELRYRATSDRIKKAYKTMVLRHHPDKRGDSVNNLDDDYYSCITKANEILGDPRRRRAYDSVDPKFDDNIPDNSQESKDSFFKVFHKVFDRNSRWSLKKNVPKLGSLKSKIGDVDDFYNFWYDFDSWREFSYLDEEDKERGGDRDERKWIERQNRAARKDRKKEEMTRIRELVDNAYSCDPRIKMFKEQEKQRKEDQKEQERQAARQVALEKQQKREALELAERTAREKEEQEQREKDEREKVERDAQKKLLKRERKFLRNSCKSNDYFCGNDSDRVKAMQDVDNLCERLTATDLTEINDAFRNKNIAGAKQIYKMKLKEVNEKFEQERQENILAGTSQRLTAGDSQSDTSDKWSEDDLQLLVKALTLFPTGTVKRYDVISDYINNHSTGSGTKISSRDVINKVKTFKQSEQQIRENVNKKAFDRFEQAHKGSEMASSQGGPSGRYGDGPVSQEKPWTAAEQKLLETALKSHPAQTEERWERIAEKVPGRTKKECMKRYKELVEMIRAKKASQSN